MDGKKDTATRVPKLIYTVVYYYAWKNVKIIIIMHGKT